jgi:hypothetical protein
MNEETITITKKEYDELCHAESVLNALYAAGVDNWDGYDMAMDMKDEDEDEEED